MRTIFIILILSLCIQTKAIKIVTNIQNGLVITSEESFPVSKCTVYTNDNVIVNVYDSEAELNEEINTMSPSLFPALPTSGEIYKDQLYSYNETIVKCLQDHLRTIFEPILTPALFAVYRENNDELEWVENESVMVGWKRISDGVTYECMQSHLTLANWHPTLTLGVLWEEVISGCDEWVQKIYSIDDCVTFNGIEYTSLINNNSWSPAAYPQGWFTDECLPYVVSVYNLGECIIFNGSTYISLINNNSWTPLTYPAGWSKQ